MSENHQKHCEERDGCVVELCHVVVFFKRMCVCLEKRVNAPRTKVKRSRQSVTCVFYWLFCVVVSCGSGKLGLCCFGWLVCRPCE